MGDSSKPRRRKHRSGKTDAPRGPQESRDARELQVREVSLGVFELVPPACALERADDLEEVTAMLEAGESEIATDELRWLLEGCPNFLAAHRLLGELALEADDLKLARGHFGIAVQLGLKAMRGIAGTLPYYPPNDTASPLPGNEAFHESAKGLVWCLVELGKLDLAREVVDQLLPLDPSDPLATKSLLPRPGDGLLPILPSP